MRNVQEPTCNPYERVPSSPDAMHNAGCDRPNCRESRSDPMTVDRWKVRPLGSLVVRVRNSIRLRQLPSKTRRPSWIALCFLTNNQGSNDGRAVYFSRRR